MLTVSEARSRCEQYGFQLWTIRRGEYRVEHPKDWVPDYYTDDLDDAVQYCWRHKYGQ